MSGTLYLVATPIGNLEDITLRALRILKEADRIACEDTRQTIKLLNHFEIKNRLEAYHKYNEAAEAERLAALLESGECIALVSDAGLPIISDPGSKLVQVCRQRGIPVEVLPGANAGLSALMLSGLDATRFTFFGFPGKSSKEFKKFVEDLAACTNTAVVYESPHHLMKMLEALKEAIPEREISISREITKKFQETQNGTAAELIEAFTQKPPRGEFVLVIQGGEPVDPAAERSALTIAEHVQSYIHEGLSEKDAIKKTAADRGLGKRDVYKEIKIK